MVENVEVLMGGLAAVRFVFGVLLAGVMAGSAACAPLVPARLAIDFDNKDIPNEKIQTHTKPLPNDNGEHGRSIPCVVRSGAGWRHNARVYLGPYPCVTIEYPSDASGKRPLSYLLCPE